MATPSPSMNPPNKQFPLQLILTILGIATLITVTVWQHRTVNQLRAEVTALRQDVRQSVTTALEQPATTADAARRENLELIKLRHDVRDLNERLLNSRYQEHTQQTIASVVRSLLPQATPTNNAPFNLRPEWKPLESLATNQYAQAMTKLKNATNDYIRFLHLTQAAKMSLAVGRNEDARQFAQDLLFLNEQFSRGDSNKSKGEALFHGHTVLGRLALDEKKIDEAKKHLLAAGTSNGSPSLDTFGPGMALAQGLLKNGEQAAVLEYLELCRRFWKMDRGLLDEWKKDIEAGRIPEFGGSLLH